MQIVQTQDGTEATVEWTCPKCQAKQSDSVHPQLGPWFSCTCGACGEAFSDEQLSPESLVQWNEARDWADSWTKECADCGSLFLFDEQIDDGYNLGGKQVGAHLGVGDYCVACID